MKIFNFIFKNRDKRIKTLEYLNKRLGELSIKELGKYDDALKSAINIITKDGCLKCNIMLPCIAWKGVDNIGGCDFYLRHILLNGKDPERSTKCGL